MTLPPFKLERYFAEHEFNTPHLLCCSDCETFSIREILDLEPGAQDRFLKLRLSYTEAPGALELRQAVAGLYENLGPEHILVHAGAEEAIFNFMQAVLEPGDHVVIQWPCYQSLYQVAASMGCEAALWTASEERGWSPGLEDLEKLLKPTTKAVVINSPHNPTGAVLSREAFAGLEMLARERGIIVFSDEVYRFLEYEEAAVRPALADVLDSAVSLGVMSKSFGLPGLRIGWIATRNEDVYRRMAAFKDYTTICNSAPAEFLSCTALRHRDRLLRRNMDLINRNRLLIEDFFARRQDFFHWTPPQAGPIAFPSLRDGRAAEPFCRDLLRKQGVLLLPGHVYGDSLSGNFRIGFGRSDLPESLARLEKYFTG